MTEADLKTFLQDNAEDIKSAVKAKAIESLLTTYRWNISEQISQAVNEFVAAEVVPAIKDHLATQKGPIIEASIAGLSNISEMLATALVQKATENMTGYRRSDIIKAIFG